MKPLTFLILSLFLFLSGGLSAQNLTVATYNLRNDNNSTDSLRGNGWKQRYPVIASMVRFYDFDIMGTQECLYHQIRNLMGLLPGYSYEGIGRDDGKLAGEFSAVFYKKDRLVPLKKGDFWLSETPGKPSKGWDAVCCNRICSWVYFRDKKTNDAFYVFNVHYDHQKDLARNESSKLMIKKIKEIAGNDPVIFMGDLNGGNDSEWYKTVIASGSLKDTYAEAKDPYANNGSFNGFGTTVTGDDIIDHVFISGNFHVEKWGLLTDTYRGKYPSDHFPVMTVLSMSH